MFAHTYTFTHIHTYFSDVMKFGQKKQEPLHFVHVYARDVSRHL